MTSETLNIDLRCLPAILGGSPTISLDHGSITKWPNINTDDETAVLNVLRDGDISRHPVVQELENDYANFTGRRHGLAHSNGTTALLAAFYSIGLKPGDEVLVPSATFWASVLPMMWLGAVPVFCESEPQRMGIDAVDMEAKITDKTRAIVVVHLWGLPSKMREIYALAKKYDLKIIEDASHAHGAYWRNKPCGALGDVSVFSLQGDKLSPAGEGGVLLTDNDEYFERAVSLGDIHRIAELEGPARRFAATSFGMKTRIAPMSAALGRSQFKRLNKHNLQRNRNTVFLAKRLENLGFDTFMPEKHLKRVYFEFLIKIDNQSCHLPVELLVEALRQEGCDVSAPRYPLLHQQPFFTEGAFKDVLRLNADQTSPDYKNVSLPVTEAANNGLLKLPSFPGKDNGILEQYARAFEKVMAYQNEIAVALHA